MPINVGLILSSVCAGEDEDDLSLNNSFYFRAQWHHGL